MDERTEMCVRADNARGPSPPRRQSEPALSVEAASQSLASDPAVVCSESSGDVTPLRTAAAVLSPRVRAGGASTVAAETHRVTRAHTGPAPRTGASHLQTDGLIRVRPP